MSFEKYWEKYEKTDCTIGFLGLFYIYFDTHINVLDKKIWGGGFFLKTPPLLPNATALNRQTCHSINRCPKAIGLDYITIYSPSATFWGLHPVLYCNLIFGNACVTHLAPLEIAMKKAVRVAAKQPPLSHTDPIFSYLNLLKLNDHYKYNLGIYMWKNIEKFSQNYRINLNNTRSGNYYEPSFQRIPITSAGRVALLVAHATSVATFFRSGGCSALHFAFSSGSAATF